MAANNPDPTYYELLNVEENASTEEIEKAFKIARRDAHPHKGQPEWVFRQVNKAYETLKDPVLRKAYDQKLKHGDSEPNPPAPKPSPTPSTASTQQSKTQPTQTSRRPVSTPNPGHKSRYVTSPSQQSVPTVKSPSQDPDVVTLDNYETKATHLEDWSFNPGKTKNLIEMLGGLGIVLLSILGLLMSWTFVTYPPLIAGVSGALVVVGALMQLRRKIDANATKISVALLVIGWILVGVPMGVFMDSPTDSPLYLGSYIGLLLGGAVGTMYARRFVDTNVINKRVPIKTLKQARIYGSPVSNTEQESATLRNISTTLAQVTQIVDGTFLLHVKGIKTKSDNLAPVDMALVHGNKVALVSHVYSSGSNFGVDSTGNLVHRYQEGITHIPNNHPEVLQAGKFLEKEYSGLQVKSFVIMISGQPVQTFESDLATISSRKDSVALLKKYFDDEDKIVRRDVLHDLSLYITN